jgi:hypothetical protein
MSQIKSSGQNLFFLVAGDSTAAALTALELARQGIAAKLVAAPGSPAAGIAISFGIPLDPSSFSLFLGRVGLTDITHLILFPTDLCELALWLGLPAFALVDSGSTHSIVSVEFASRMHDVCVRTPRPRGIRSFRMGCFPTSL